jgi:hypothetical protein
VREPVGQGGHQVTGSRGKCALGALGDLIDTEAVGDGRLVQPLHHLAEAGGELGGELVEIVQHRRKPDGQEDAKNQTNSGDNQEDSSRFGGPSSADVGVHDAIDNGHQHGRKERADVDQNEFLRQQINQAKAQQKGEGEEDVAANNATRMLFGGTQIVNVSQRHLLYSDVSV